MALCLLGLLGVAVVDRDDALRWVSAELRKVVLLLLGLAAELPSLLLAVLSRAGLLALDADAAVEQEGLGAGLAPEDLADGRFGNDATVHAAFGAVARDELAGVLQLLVFVVE